MNKPFVIRAENISKTFVLKKDKREIKRTVIENVSFSLEKGDAMALIGVNGTGKSTLLKILSNIIKPTTGKIEIYGSYASILEIGSGFHPDLTGRENIDLYHSLISPNTLPRVDEIIDFSELREFMDTPVKFYSNGMYLRLAFSIAIHADSDLIFLDEVMAVGDSVFRNKCYQKIMGKRKEGCTFIIASHDMPDLLKLCNKGIWVKKNGKAEYGSSGEVVSAYLAKIHSETVLKSITNFPDKIISGNIRVYYIRLLDDENKEKCEFPFNSTIIIEVKIESKLIEKGLMPVIELENESGSVIAILGSIYKEVLNITKGTSVFQLKIPLMLLNLGVYALNFRIFRGGIDFFYEKRALVFKIIGDGIHLEQIQKANPFHIVAGQANWQISKGN